MFKIFKLNVDLTVLNLPIHFKKELSVGEKHKKHCKKHCKKDDK